MDDRAENQPDGVRGRRRSGQATRRDAAQPATRPAAKRVKRTFVLTIETSERLDTHALGVKKTVSQVVEDLVAIHCRRFSLHDRGGVAATSKVPDENGVVN